MGVGFRVARVASAQRREPGWSEVTFRSTDPPVTSLRPQDTDEARPNSLSSRYGKAAQPLHTDGAHLPEPPDFVLLLAEKTSEVSTLLWKCEIIHYQLPSYTDLLHGEFLVRNGSESFFRDLEGVLEGDEEIGRERERTVFTGETIHDGAEYEYDYDYPTFTLTIAADYFSCRHCHLVLDRSEFVEQAGLPAVFEVEGVEDSEYGEPDYGND
jgi:hypothetical protein